MGRGADIPDTLRAALKLVSDELVSSPLWGFLPSERSAVLSERARRSLLQHDPEPSGDPEYN